MLTQRNPLGRHHFQHGIRHDFFAYGCCPCAKISVPRSWICNRLIPHAYGSALAIPRRFSGTEKLGRLASHLKLEAHVNNAIETLPRRECPALVITGRSKISWALAVRELWQYRELLYFLVWRDVKVRYKQTVLGLAWAVVQPLFIALTLSLFLGRLAKLPSGGVPYIVFAYTAMVPWQLFASALTDSSNSLVANERLITKVYFPRVVVPMSTVLGGLVDFTVAFAVLIPFLAYYHITPTVTALAAPFFVLLAALISFGAGLWLSALNVQYRDVRYTVGFLIQLWFFLTPVVYPSSVVPEKWRALYGLNPMAGVVEGFRWALLGTGEAPVRLVSVSVLAAALIVVSGFYYFRHMEDTFADVI
ncbi:MAG: ABC transporter permease [Acidobacteria bacterium]|nr:ABC transporter permease [Acidobacteriota bacterium]